MLKGFLRETYIKVNAKKSTTFASILPVKVERVSLVQEALAASA
jgi:hypothetical protein